MKLKEIKGFLIDLDGTIYRGDSLIPGAKAFIEKLQQSQKPFLFLSNNSSKSPQLYVEKLHRLGIDVNTEQVFTSLSATMIYLNRFINKRRIYPVGTLSFEKELMDNGFVLTEKDPDFVLLGFDTSLTYEKIYKAAVFLQQGVPLIATHPDRTCPTETYDMPDTGAMIALFHSATNVSPKIIGKPNKEMIRSALNLLKLRREEVAIIGDRLYTDIAMGVKSKIFSILVLSGETKKTDLETAKYQPSLVINSVYDIIDEV